MAYLEDMLSQANETENSVELRLRKYLCCLLKNSTRQKIANFSVFKFSLKLNTFTSFLL